MPAYDFRCRNCGRRFTLFYKTVAEYNAALHACPACKSTDLTRVIRRVRMMRSEESRLDSLDDMVGLDNLDDADPRALGRVMRRMSAEIGEDLGPEFDEVVGRLEAGESPESIEESMGDALDNLGGDAGDEGGFDEW